MKHQTSLRAARTLKFAAGAKRQDRPNKGQNPWMVHFGVIILAAGGSARLGFPKQLSEIGGQSLLERAVDAAAQSGAQEVVVVLGANGEDIRKTVQDRKAKVVLNASWKSGMASSIGMGIRALGPGTEAAVIMLCDQPAVTPEHLRALADGLSDIKPIAASSYGGVEGVPAAFGRVVFAELLTLEGDIGAREIIRSNPARVQFVPFAGGEKDVDEIDDLYRDS